MNPPNKRTDQAASISTLTEMITGLVKGVVTHPDHVQIRQSTHGSLVAFVIKTHLGDVRRVVGAQGKHIKAITTLAEAFALRRGLETHIVINEDIPPTRTNLEKGGFLGTADQMTMKSFEKLLLATIMPFADEAEGVEIVTANAGPTKIIEVKVPVALYMWVYGRPTKFEYGVDGHIIGSIKHIFDGIAKNQGRLIRITLTQVLDSKIPPFASDGHP